jgi:hypothetical protein
VPKGLYINNFIFLPQPTAAKLKLEYGHVFAGCQDLPSAVGDEQLSPANIRDSPPAKRKFDQFIRAVKKSCFKTRPRGPIDGSMSIDPTPRAERMLFQAHRARRATAGAYVVVGMQLPTYLPPSLNGYIPPSAMERRAGLSAIKAAS